MNERDRLCLLAREGRRELAEAERSPLRFCQGLSERVLKGSLSLSPTSLVERSVGSFLSLREIVTTPKVRRLFGQAHRDTDVAAPLQRVTAPRLELVAG